jgi:hypothetical protein
VGRAVGLIVKSANSPVHLTVTIETTEDLFCIFDSLD